MKKKNNFSIIKKRLGISAISLIICSSISACHKLVMDSEEKQLAEDSVSVLKDIGEPIIVEEITVSDDDIQKYLSVSGNDIVIENPKDLIKEKFSLDKFNDNEEVVPVIEYETDEEIAEEEKADRQTEYIISLQEINKNNPLEGIDMESFMNEHYDELLYDSKLFTDIKRQYAALAYKRLESNENIDIMLAFDELENVMLYQLNPTELDQYSYNRTFGELIKTLNENENVYDIYFPLANQFHQVGCLDEHYIDSTSGCTWCDSLIEKYETKDIILK